MSAEFSAKGHGPTARTVTGILCCHAISTPPAPSRDVRRRQGEAGEDPPPPFRLFQGGRRPGQREAHRPDSAGVGADVVRKALEGAAAGAAPPAEERRVEVEAAEGAGLAVRRDAVRARLRVQVEEGRGGRGRGGRRERRGRWGDGDNEGAAGKMTLEEYEERRRGRVTLDSVGVGMGVGVADDERARQEEADRRFAEVRVGRSVLACTFGTQLG